MVPASAVRVATESSVAAGAHTATRAQNDAGTERNHGNGVPDTPDAAHDKVATVAEPPGARAASAASARPKKLVVATAAQPALISGEATEDGGGDGRCGAGTIGSRRRTRTQIAVA